MKFSIFKTKRTVQVVLVYKRMNSTTAISRKVVGKSARDNPERYCGWFCVHCSSEKFERMAREAMDIRLRVLKEGNKSRFDSYSVRNSELIVSHITFGDCRVYIFSDNFSRNSCMLNRHSAGSARGFCQCNKVELDLHNHSQQIKSTRTYQQTEVQVSCVKGPAFELVTIN